MGFGVWLYDQRVRLLHVDAPELRGGTEASRRRARASRDFVRAELSSAEKLMVRTTKSRNKGKYGRWLAEIVYRRGSKWYDLAEELLKHGYAVGREYD